jgi:isoleucyl-tRNA synthetase
VKVKTINQYTGIEIVVILAKDLMPAYFNENNKELLFEDYKVGDKNLPFIVLDEFKGSKLEGIAYAQLINWVKPKSKAFEVLLGDFVTTEDGTGIVHIAPTFGADDFRIAKQYNFPAILVDDINGNTGPLVDRQGRFIPIENIDASFTKQFINEQEYKEFAGKFVKNEYDETIGQDTPTIDVEIAVHLKKQNKAFKIEKHTHNYPHCWRTDKPVIYYPLDSWFVKTTALKDRMIELNDTINWKPESTGTGRFGKWLENLQDWNLSRSRYWGTPLPIWTTEDKMEVLCIGSVAELQNEIDKSVKAGFMKENPLKSYIGDDFSQENYEKFDLHRPFVDTIFLVSPSGKKMTRETDLIDVWFDSGAMPYAQFHYPFAIKDQELNQVFPADFIAEGVDQTRGWFFTLHAIAVMLFDKVAFKNIISNGLVLDKNGNKMSKRLGNAVDPFETIQKHGSDPLRWYMITNAQPWDNLKFDMEGIEEVKRKFFGTLYNTYSFFALYANVDGFNYKEPDIPVNERPEIDRWIISLLNSLIKDVNDYYESYEPTKAGRAIQDFVIENLSNWYVRLNRKRYWGGEYSKDKLAAYQTLYTCLITVAKLASPIAPFYTDKLFIDLNSITGKDDCDSVHLSHFPEYDSKFIDKALEERMDWAQKFSSMVLGLRRKVNIKVRQPLNKIIIPILNKNFKSSIEQVENLILSEVNVKEVEYLKDTAGMFVKRIKPNFKTLGPRYGQLMKAISAEIAHFRQDSINKLETVGSYELRIGDQDVILTMEDVEIATDDIPGWQVANEGALTVALDINITPELRQEGIAREFVNRIQNLRKESGFDVTDKILVSIQKHEVINEAVEGFKKYISTQTLAAKIDLVDSLTDDHAKQIELDDNVQTLIKIHKI